MDSWVFKSYCSISYTNSTSFNPSLLGLTYLISFSDLSVLASSSKEDEKGTSVLLLKSKILTAEFQGKVAVCYLVGEVAITTFFNYAGF